MFAINVNLQHEILIVDVTIQYRVRNREILYFGEVTNNIVRLGGAHARGSVVWIMDPIRIPLTSVFCHLGQHYINRIVACFNVVFNVSNSYSSIILLIAYRASVLFANCNDVQFSLKKINCCRSCSYHIVYAVNSEGVIMGPTQGPYILQLFTGPSYFWRV